MSDDRRLRTCVEAWPDCFSGGYHPQCCRFPKSCSPHPYPETPVTDADLEPARETQDDRCGAEAVGGPCILPVGHNVGKADVPENHSATLVGLVTTSTMRGKYAAVRMTCNAAAPLVANGAAFVGCQLDRDHVGQHEVVIRWVR